MSSRSVDSSLDRLLQVSGKPALVQEAPELSTLSTVQIARGSAHAHLIMYHPSASPCLNYLITFQCGFLIRIYSLSEKERFDLAPSPHGKQEARKLVNERMRLNHLELNSDVQQHFVDQMLNGLGLQLRSIPVGLRVDAEILRESPELRDQQRASIERQLQDNLATVRPEVKQISPEIIYAANLGMNAAYACFWARAWGDAHLTTPYKATGHLTLGQELLAIWDKIPSDMAEDRQLIEAWATRLGVRTWYDFLPGPAI